MSGHAPKKKKPQPPVNTGAGTLPPVVGPVIEETNTPKGPGDTHHDTSDAALKGAPSAVADLFRERLTSLADLGAAGLEPEGAKRKVLYHLEVPSAEHPDRWVLHRIEGLSIALEVFAKDK